MTTFWSLLTLPIRFQIVLREAKLADNDVEGIREQDLQLIFEAVIAASPKKAEGFGSKLLLGRQEWLAVLAMIALRRGMEIGGGGVAESINSFFENDLRPAVPAACIQDSNKFREIYCYHEETDMVLRRYEASLHALYVAFAFGDGAIGSALLSTKLLDYSEFMELIGRLEMIDTFITQRDVRLAFIWSRMVVVADKTVKGRSRVIQHHFENFLETIVRFAHLMAMPSEAELQASGHPHAGEYLAELSERPDAEKRFKQERTRGFDDPSDGPISSNVCHFVQWMLYRARGDQGDPETELTQKEADRFKNGAVKRVERNKSEEVVALARAATPKDLKVEANDGAVELVRVTSGGPGEES